MDSGLDGLSPFYSPAMSTNGWNAGDWTTAERGDESTATRRPDHWADCSPSVDDGWRQDPWADDHWRPNGQGDGAASEHGRLIEEFLTGEAGRDVASEQDHEWLLEAVLRFAREHGYDPMVLTPVAVEVLLLDWVARELRDDGHYLLKLPGVLGDFVAYGHRRKRCTAGGNHCHADRRVPVNYCVLGNA